MSSKIEKCVFRCRPTKGELDSRFGRQVVANLRYGQEMTFEMYEWSEQVRFHPWIGSNYNNSPHKILLLGDSHHGGEYRSDYTQYAINHHLIEGKKRIRFFTCIIWTVFGDYTNNIVEEEFNNVAFYNYVQKLMPDSRMRPSNDDYEAAKMPFIEVLEKIQPEFIITFGKAVFDYFPITKDVNKWEEDAADETHAVNVNTINVCNNSIHVYALPHPCGNKFNMRIYNCYFSKRGISLNNFIKKAIVR